MRLKPFGLGRVLYSDIVRADEDIEDQFGVEYCGLPDLLKLSDIVSLHAPLTDATRNMIGKDELDAMKPTAYLINVARGELVDEEALAEALRNGRIAGAAVDVFSEEPVSPENPLLKIPGNKVAALAPCGRRIERGSGQDHQHGDEQRRPGAQGRRAALYRQSASHKRRRP